MTLIVGKLMRYLRTELQWRFCLLLSILIISVIKLEHTMLHEKIAQISLLRSHAEVILTLPRLESKMVLIKGQEEQLKRQKEEELRSLEEERLRKEAKYEEQMGNGNSSQKKGNEGKSDGWVLEGVSFQDGEYVALIDGMIYETGDIVREYRVDIITINQVILKHTETWETRILQFQGIPEVNLHP